MGFLSGLPKDVKIAAHPRVADDIPLITKRSVIACEETSQSYYLGYYRIVKPMISAEIEACLRDRRGRRSTSSAIASAPRCSSSTSTATGARSTGRRTYYEPFRSEVRRLIDAGEKSGFALENPPPDRVLFRSGRLHRRAPEADEVSGCPNDTATDPWTSRSCFPASTRRKRSRP